MQTINTATPALLALAKKAANPGPGLMVAGRGVVNLLKAHYRKKQREEPNKLGGKRTNFWRGVADSVNQPVQAGPVAVTVSISHPHIRQKIYGGEIRAKRTKYLSIPIDPEAHGRTASTVESSLGVKLFVVASGGKAFLAAKGGADGAVRFFYALKRSVNQKADPTALPPDSEIEGTAVKYFTRWLMRQ